jgi:hypothetical protein
VKTRKNVASTLHVIHDKDIDVTEDLEKPVGKAIAELINEQEKKEKDETTE